MPTDEGTEDALIAQAREYAITAHKRIDQRGK